LKIKYQHLPFNSLHEWSKVPGNQISTVAARRKLGMPKDKAPAVYTHINICPTLFKDAFSNTWVKERIRNDGEESYGEKTGNVLFPRTEDAI
jgi:hypothetical protein